MQLVVQNTVFIVLSRVSGVAINGSKLGLDKYEYFIYPPIRGGF